MDGARSCHPLFSILHPRPATLDPMRSADQFISLRALAVDASGIRKVFDLAAKMKDPINLSIGLPDFDVPDIEIGKADREVRSEEHTSELQSHVKLVCRLLLEKKKKNIHMPLGFIRLLSMLFHWLSTLHI